MSSNALRRGVATVAVAACVVWAGAVSAQNDQKSGQSVSEQAAMDAWMKSIQPNEHQKRLEPFVGDWSLVTRWWMAPGGAPEESTGTAHYEMIMGGRYLRETVQGQMMGMPFEGEGWTGYDNLAHKYVSSWIDNFGTGIMMSDGQWDEATGTLETVASMLDPMTGKPTTMRMTVRMTDPQHHVAEFYGPGPDGKEFKTMEIVYTKK